MAQALADPPARAGAAGLAASAIARLDDAPSWIYQIFFRLGLAFLFGYSGWNKLSRWDNTLKLFRDMNRLSLSSLGNPRRTR